MSFPRYPEYKDSGVEWLGEVPGHWGVGRLKRSTVSSKNGVWGDEAKQDVNDIPCVRVADFDRQGLRVELVEPTIRNIPDSERVGRILVQGDLLLEKSGGGEGQPVGCIVLYDDPLPAVCSNFVARIQTAPGMDSSFWRYVHAAAYAVRLNTRSIKQTSGIQNLDASQYFDELAGFPPLPEQTQIAAFLDRETAKIDALVAEQRRLMALLKEKRQAVISHAVTKGLNPNAPMKPSGIEWLGDVPAHWEVLKLKFLCDVQTGDKDTENAVEEGAYPFFVRSQTVERINSMAFDCEAILTAGDGAGVGKVFHYHNGPFDFHQRVYMMNNFRGVSGPYLFHFFRENFYKVALEGGAKSTVDSLRRPMFMNFTVCVPPKAEQASIVAEVESSVDKFDTLTTEAQRAIDLLQERRTALISAAVTGQIDVRENTQKGKSS
jgi:type I restriction enzyme, S subunit